MHPILAYILALQVPNSTLTRLNLMFFEMKTLLRSFQLFISLNFELNEVESCNDLKNEDDETISNIIIKIRSF